MNDLAMERLRLLFSAALGRNLTKTQIEPLKKELVPLDESLPLLALPCGSTPRIEAYISLAERERVLLSILATLHHYKVTTVEVTYSGSGDSGQINSVDIVGWAEEASGGDKRSVLKDEVLTPFGGTLADDPYPGRCCLSLEEALRDFVEKEATDHGGNWIDNEGGGGTAIIDVPEMTARFEHYSNMEDTETIKHEPISFKELNPAIRVYLKKLAEEEPDLDSFEVAFTTSGEVEFNSFDSTSEVDPPKSFEELASDFAEGEESYQVMFTFCPASDEIAVTETVFVHSTDDASFEVTIDPETFSS